MKIPKVLTEMRKYYKPGNIDATRRKNEMQVMNEVESFLKSLYFSTNRNFIDNEIRGETIHGGEFVSIFFSYKETDKRVDKSMIIKRNGFPTNIGTIKQIVTLRGSDTPPIEES